MSSLYKGTSVIELNDSHFQGKIAPGLIMFYAAYCPYCQMKRDTYIQLADKLNSGPFKIYSVNIKDPKSVRATLSNNISTIPAFYKVGSDGTLTSYDERYDPSAIEQMAKGQKGGGRNQRGGGAGLNINQIAKYVDANAPIYVADVAKYFGVTEAQLVKYISNQIDSDINTVHKLTYDINSKDRLKFV